MTSQEQITEIENQIRHLDELLHPCSPAEISERMKVLFANLPTQDKGMDEDLRAQAFVYVLKGTPVGVLTKVVWDILDARVEGFGLVFAPTTPQMAQLCRERTWQLHGRKRELEARLRDLQQPRLPALPALSPEQRAAEERRREAKVAAAKVLIQGVVEKTDMKRALALQPLDDIQLAQAIRFIEEAKASCEEVTVTLSPPEKISSSAA